MLQIRHISLFQFKNYTNRSVPVGSRIVGICGNNGVGKTNLLDAVHYLCFTKSYFSRSDAPNVQQGRSGFRVDGRVALNGHEEKATCILRENGKKEFLVDDQPYDRFSQHIGRYPCVVIAPDDAQLITGGPEERRKFLDSLLSQLDPVYLQQLILYTRVLQQRNSLLKTFAETGVRNLALLDVLDQQLSVPGNYIFDKRRDFLVSFLPAVRNIYIDIARRQEELVLLYESQLLDTGFDTLLQQARPKDLPAQRSSAGIHRDDIDIRMGDMPFRSIASQGQRKSLLFALKLAEMDVLRQEKGFAPLLLLDDVFEKLDSSRIGSLLERVCRANDGQVFITDTSEERLRLQLESIGEPFEMILL
ncbi:MAG: DNA replication and repair protein RecF [Chitinophagaceae bacterium]|nr:MAG: DNA replication and repair protein RecF [Chitinophagaceae bacterium]